MKTDEKLHSIALVSSTAVLFLILISPTALASITETRIGAPGGVTGLDFYSNKVVWSNLGGNIYIYDLSDKKGTLIKDVRAYAGPSLFDNKIVYINFQNNVSMYDLSTHKEIQITNSGGADDVPDIYGNKIVYIDYRHEKWDVYMYDLSTKTETRITNGKNSSHPIIYDNKIVWSDKRVWNDNKIEKYNIHMYNLTTHKETQITSSGSAQYPSIYNNKIVWLDYRHDNSDSEWEYPDIYMYDLTTNKETRITTYKSYKCCPYIYGNSIGWHDERNLSGGGIYLYDISTHQEIHSKTSYGAPIIYGNKMVWVDNRNDDDGDVYMGVFSYLPIAAFTASSTSGKHPMNVKFIDKSTDAYYWNWNFGDKTTSTLQSPTHKYTKAGKYTVTLTVKNAAGSNTMKKTNYITIK